MKKGKVLISGYAWSGLASIKKVEVSVNGGKSWNKADIYSENISVVRFNYIYDWQGKRLLFSLDIDNKLRTQPTRKQVIKKWVKMLLIILMVLLHGKLRQMVEIEHIYI